MKYEWRKAAKDLYLPKKKPVQVTVPSFSYFMLDGQGNPNDEAFSEAIGVLYSLSFTLKMLPKKGIEPAGYFDYTVFPLEGVWDMDGTGDMAQLDKNKFMYTIMIRQPDFVTDALAEEVLELVKKKKPHPLLEQVRFERVEEGRCVQMMHIGAYDDEDKSFKLMNEYCEENQLERCTHTHREIYLSDPRKVAPEKLKTVLRYEVREI